MLKVDRTTRTFSRLDAPTLSEAQILERDDLQECILNSSNEFFAEIGEKVFVLGKEVSPSQTVQDRIDLLGIDSEGTTVVVELKRGSNKLQMLQAVSYAGMVARWGLEDFRDLVSEHDWEQLTDFLDVDIEEINRKQRLLLVAEGFDYALLAGAEWLSEEHGVDIRCSTVSLATDPKTGAEYLACASIFPPPALAEQAVARSRSGRTSRSSKWSNWEEALTPIENEALKNFVSKEIEDGRENYLGRRVLYFRLDGKRRWSFICRMKLGYVWQRGRFIGDEDFWASCISEADSVQPVKSGEALRFKLLTTNDFRVFQDAVNGKLRDHEWVDSGHGDELDNHD